ncbi:MAG: enoyl-CoA hydratase/isomerase family protein [Candidatus Binatia bacterium]
MTYKTILTEQSNGIMTITMNRPEVLNAITTTMLAELKEAVDEAGTDPQVGVVVLTGVGRAFSAGVDLKALGKLPLENGAIGPILDNPARALIRSIQTIPKVVIAKVNGFCFTGALELALACDLMFVAQEAKLGDTHAKWGLRPTWGMSARLPQTAGFRKARELSFTADTFTGSDAAAWGIANRAVPLADLAAAVQTVADKILANSRDSIAAYKVLYNQGSSKTVTEAVAFEEQSVFPISDSNERVEKFR